MSALSPSSRISSSNSSFYVPVSPYSPSPSSNSRVQVAAQAAFSPPIASSTPTLFFEQNSSPSSDRKLIELFQIIGEGNSSIETLLKDEGKSESEKAQGLREILPDFELTESMINHIGKTTPADIVDCKISVLIFSGFLKALLKEKEENVGAISRLIESKKLETMISSYTFRSSFDKEIDAILCLLLKKNLATTFTQMLHLLDRLGLNIKVEKLGLLRALSRHHNSLHVAQAIERYLEQHPLELKDRCVYVTCSNSLRITNICSLLVMCALFAYVASVFARD